MCVCACVFVCVYSDAFLSAFFLDQWILMVDHTDRKVRFSVTTLH